MNHALTACFFILLTCLCLKKDMTSINGLITHENENMRRIENEREQKDLRILRVFLFQNIFDC